MPDLLLELFSRRNPRPHAAAGGGGSEAPRHQRAGRAQSALRGRAEPSSRRGGSTLHVVGLPAAQPDLREERKGPRVGAPDAAIQGFLKSAGLSRIEEAHIETDPKKGEFYVALIEKPGPRHARTLIAEILPPIIRAFPWPKSMRWGAALGEARGLALGAPAASESFARSRPSTRRRKSSPFAIDGLVRATSPGATASWRPRRSMSAAIDDYVDALQKAKVVLDADRRKAIILADAKDLAFAQGLTLVEDEGLLEEVAGLVEWPVVLMGEFEPEFLDLPPEVIRATIRANQKCFVLRDASGKLANHFILVSNLVAARRRRGDRRRQWARRARAALGRAPLLGDRSRSPARLPQTRRRSRSTSGWRSSSKASSFTRSSARRASASSASRRWRGSLRRKVGADAELAARAARLAKADLATEMVGEFPELQGLMGRYYASAQGEDPASPQAIEEHYKPQGPNDRIPTSPVSIAVALADKLDTLVGFWAIDEKPTGQQGPLCAAARGAGRDPDCAGERAAAAAVALLQERVVAPPSSSRGAKRRGDPGRRMGALPPLDRLPRTRIREVAMTTRRDDLRPPRLLRRPPESLPARQGRAARSHRRRLRAARPGRPPDDRAPGRGARKAARQPKTARICSPAIAAPPTSCKPRRRRTAPKLSAASMSTPRSLRRRRFTSPTPSLPQARPRASGWRTRISRAPCGRWPSCACPSTPSSST